MDYLEGLVEGGALVPEPWLGVLGRSKRYLLCWLRCSRELTAETEVMGNQESRCGSV